MYLRPKKTHIIFLPWTELNFDQVGMKSYMADTPSFWLLLCVTSAMETHLNIFSSAFLFTWHSHKSHWMPNTFHNTDMTKGYTCLCDRQTSTWIKRLEPETDSDSSIFWLAGSKETVMCFGLCVHQEDIWKIRVHHRDTVKTKTKWLNMSLICQYLEWQQNTQSTQS